MERILNTVPIFYEGTDTATEVSNGNELGENALRDVGTATMGSVGTRSSPLPPTYDEFAPSNQGSCGEAPEKEPGLETQSPQTRRQRRKHESYRAGCRSVERAVHEMGMKHAGAHADDGDDRNLGGESSGQMS